MCAAALNDASQPWPSLALAQRLWDAPLDLVPCADPTHILHRSGLLRPSGGDWNAPLDMPAAVAQGLQAFEPVQGRSRAFGLDGGRITLVDDSYNANPDSVRAAIDVLAELPGPRLLVLGDMGEVGNQGPAFHAEVGAYAAERGLEHLFTLGELAAHADRKSVV